MGERPVDHISGASLALLICISSSSQSFAGHSLPVAAASPVLDNTLSAPLLAAILSADAVGYSRLMQADEPATVETLNAYRAAMRRVIERHKGRVVNAPGDALLAEFASVVEAVARCGGNPAGTSRAATWSLPPERRMHFRIGVNLGDVIEQDDGSIYGDGVNIAARMEALAEGGGVCVSSTVFDAVEGKLALGFDFLGEQQVKNIAKPVRVYRVRTEKGAEKAACKGGAAAQMALAGGGRVGTARRAGRARRVACIGRQTSPTPSMAGRNRVAVLPFVNISADPKDEYFADGMTEELISKLSRVGGLEVIARTSVMSYKGTTKKIGEIGRELNVGTVLEGSVRKQGDKLRVTAQLIGVDNEVHLWAEDYDRDLKGVFAIQKDIAARVATAMAARLGAVKPVAHEARGTQNLDAYNAYLKGRFHLAKASVDGVLKAIDHFEEATRMDPSWAVAYAALADGYEQLPIQDDSYSKEVYPKARVAALKALRARRLTGGGHTALGVVQTFHDRDWAAAGNSFKRALELNPNSAATHWWYGWYLLFLRQFDEGIREMRRALELDPVSIPMNVDLVWALEFPGRFDEALQQAKKTLEMDPNNVEALVRPRQSQIGTTASMPRRSDQSSSMEIKPIRTRADYRAALKEIEALMLARAGTSDGERLDVLVTLVEAYERKHFPMSLPDPVEAIKFVMDQRGLSAKDLEPMIGRTNRVYEVLNRKRPLTLKMIWRLHKELGIPAESLIRPTEESEAV